MMREHDDVDDAFLDAMKERRTPAQPPEPPSAWNQVAIRLRDLLVTLEDGKDEATGHLLEPDASTAEIAFLAAWREARRTLGEAIGKVDDLLAGLRTTSPPEEPLQSVLAEIVAEGHRVVRLIRYDSVLVWGCQSNTGGREAPAQDADPTDWDRWRTEIESGEANDADPLVAARARLADIREGRAQRAVTGEEARRVDAASEGGA